jgi:hypothetical protein
MVGAYELCCAIEKYFAENKLSGTILVGTDYVKVTDLHSRPFNVLTIATIPENLEALWCEAEITSPAIVEGS